MWEHVRASGMSWSGAPALGKREVERDCDGSHIILLMLAFMCAC